MAIASILDSVKKGIGIDLANTVFDDVLVMHVNATLAKLTQIGVGPVQGYQIDDNTATWDTFLTANPNLNAAKSYMINSVKMRFDPPTIGFLINAMNALIVEDEWRLNSVMEATIWTDPDPRLP